MAKDKEWSVGRQMMTVLRTTGTVKLPQTISELGLGRPNILSNIVKISVDKLEFESPLHPEERQIALT